VLAHRVPPTAQVSTVYGIVVHLFTWDSPNNMQELV